MPILRRRADVVEGSFDESARTVDICWSTGARGINIYFGEEIVDAQGKRLEKPEYWTPIEEELSLDEGHVRLEELQAHGPFLDDHRQRGGLDAILGSIRRAWVEKGKAYATISVRPGLRGDEVVAGLRSGDLRSFSAGYRVKRFLDVTPANAKVRRLRAIDWTPKEVSIVPIPFDKGVGVRAEGTDFETCEIARGGGLTNMDEQLDENGNPITPASERSEGGGTPAPAAAPAATATATAPATSQRSEADDERVAKAERKRIAEIERLYTRNGAPDELKRQAIDQGWDSARSRGALLDFLDKKDAETPHGTAHMAHVGTDGFERFRKSAEDLLMNRLDPSHKLTDGLSLRGTPLLALGQELLRQRGIRVDSFRPMDIAGQVLGLSTRSGSMTTSDFPQILANVASKRLMKAYQEAENTFAPWTTRSSNPDFKPSKRVRMSDAPGLLEKPESANYEYGALGEQAEDISVKTYGRILSISRETMVNDDLSLFSRVTTAMGRRAQQLEGDLAYGVLNANPNMSDSVALFHTATHGNLGSGVIGSAGLTAGFLAMRKQKAPNGTFLNIRPKGIIVPAALEYTARKELLEDYVANTAANTNPWRGQLEIIVDARLDAVSATAWYLFADPMLVDTIELATLSGYDGPYLEEWYDNKSEAVEWKVRHDVGAKAIDWLGLYKSTGV